tara:strand:+ start:202 stop:345 length:144 start_codon:yes stop_codon:yes gene_type:complete
MGHTCTKKCKHGHSKAKKWIEERVGNPLDYTDKTAAKKSAKYWDETL